MSAFAIAMAITAKWEGGFVDDPHDNGGVTKYGISIRFAGSVGLDIDGDGKTTRADITKLTKEQAIALYRIHFWQAASCDLLPQALAIYHFDTAVNMGVKAAAKLLQKACGVSVDGIIGTKTLAAINGQNQASILDAYAAARVDKYRTFSDFKRFGRGWLNRSADVLAYAKKYR